MMNRDANRMHDRFYHPVVQRMRRTIRVTVDDGDHWDTEINGTEAEIRANFPIGSRVNLGVEEDRIRTITSLEFLA